MGWLCFYIILTGAVFVVCELTCCSLKREIDRLRSYLANNEMTLKSHLIESNGRKSIAIKYMRGVEHIQKIEVGDWIDLRAAETVWLKKGDLRLIKLGVAMELPEGYEAIIASRSSTPKKFGIIQANGIGIIDNSYCGDDDEWGFMAYALRDIIINKNDRICQFRIVKNQPEIKFIEVEELGNESRGGFGSTGVK